MGPEKIFGWISRTLMPLGMRGLAEKGHKIYFGTNLKKVGFRPALAATWDARKDRIQVTGMSPHVKRLAFYVRLR